MSGVLSWAEVHDAEQAAIKPAIPQRQFAALCLSGGGVRSAAYCLGVLQALARRRALGRFHYLSTVSGGGYIGAWLQVTISRFGVDETQARLGRPAPGGAPDELNRLRSYTNWLFPNGGWMSLDGWTTITIYLRNVLLNWLMFGPLFLILALLCVGARSSFFGLQTPPGSAPHGFAVAMGLGFALAAVGGLVLGTVEACRGLPSRLPPEPGATPGYWQAAEVRWRILAPSLLWAFCLPPALGPTWHWLMRGGTLALWAVPLLFFIGSVGGYVAAAITRPPGAPGYWGNLPPWTLASAAGALVPLGALHFARGLSADQAAEIVAVGAPPALLLGQAALSGVHAALRNARRAPRIGPPPDRFANLDAEWMARISAMRLQVAAAWFAAALCVLSGANAILRTEPLTGLRPAWLTALLAGPIVAWGGKQAFSQFNALVSGKARLVTWDLLLRAGAAVFAAAVLLGSGIAVQRMLGIMQGLFATPAGDGFFAPAAPACRYDTCILPASLLLGAALLAIAAGADTWIRTNQFSMHGFYRNRLARAFIGTARAAWRTDAPGSRHPDPFTGFDPGDNPHLCSLAVTAPRRLFPVINATLNLAAVQRPDWMDRKAAPFTFTPLHCGAAFLDRGQVRYVPAAQYSGSGTEPVSLGTAVTVSGAAVSPNWGYHSSPLTAFLMTLFNVRLGAWLPNPAHWPLPKWEAGAPGWRLLQDELFAAASDRRSYVYLSDGGHFDNLGIYEMLRRRCGLIVAVDATHDPDRAYSDLGALIGKARIDGLADVRFSGAADDPALPGLGLGVIAYPSGPPGLLLLLKPRLDDDAPADVRAYHAAHAAFPNEATTDQWFTESQFESYRALGLHQAAKLLAQSGTLRMRRRALAEARPNSKG